MSTPRPRHVALTGGIATGKSHCLERFADLGIPTLDADVVARDVVAPGTSGLEAIGRRFGPSVLTASGALDRAALAARVFTDEAARRDLESIVHPRVYDAILAWRQSQDARQPPPAATVVDVPLLFETDRQGDFDGVIVAWCRPDQQMDRMVRERGMTEAEARQRLDAQWPVDRKRALADFVIDTSGSLEETDRQVTKTVAALVEGR